MITSEEEKLRILLKQLQEIFRINNWIIKLNFVLGGDNEAETILLYNENYATITIKNSLSLENKIKSLIHEVIHIIKRNSQQIAIDNIENENIKIIWTREMEREQEMLASGIYELIIKNNKYLKE